jgi:hypothetical protein
VDEEEGGAGRVAKHERLLPFVDCHALGQIVLCRPFRKPCFDTIATSNHLGANGSLSILAVLLCNIDNPHHQLTPPFLAISVCTEQTSEIVLLYRGRAVIYRHFVVDYASTKRSAVRSTSIYPLRIAAGNESRPPVAQQESSLLLAGHSGLDVGTTVSDE